MPACLHWSLPEAIAGRQHDSRRVRLCRCSTAGYSWPSLVTRSGVRCLQPSSPSAWPRPTAQGHHAIGWRSKPQAGALRTGSGGGCLRVNRVRRKREQRKCELALLPPREPRPRWSRGCGVLSVLRGRPQPYDRNSNQRASKQSEVATTPSAASLSAASARFAAIDAIPGCEESDKPQDRKHDGRMGADEETSAKGERKHQPTPRLIRHQNLLPPKFVPGS